MPLITPLLLASNPSVVAVLFRLASVSFIETEVKTRHTIMSPPSGSDINAGGESVNCLIGANPDQRP